MVFGSFIGFDFSGPEFGSFGTAFASFSLTLGSCFWFLSALPAFGSFVPTFWPYFGAIGSFRPASGFFSAPNALNWIFPHLLFPFVQFADQVIQSCQDPFKLQLASLDVAMVRKKQEEELGSVIEGDLAYFLVTEVRMLNPAARIELGNEIFQVRRAKTIFRL